MIDEIVCRLEAETTSFKLVTHAYSMTMIDNISEETPAVFVYPGEESASESGFDSQVIQQNHMQAVAIIVGSTSGVEALKKDVRSALIGWQPSQYHDPVQLVKGRPEEISSSHIWWKEIYTSSVQLRD